jgi:hypothetical protein
MRPASNSESPTQTPEKLNPTSGKDDVLMMGFEFFNKKGQLSPKKIVFTDKTCPNETQRVLSNLFRKLMEWSASLWAKNLLEATRIELEDKGISQDPANVSVKTQIDSLMQNIRKNGFVRMPELFNLVALADEQVKAPNKNDDQNSTIQTGNRFTPYSTPFLINHDEVVQSQSQPSSSNQEEIGSTKVDAKDTKPDNADLIGACQIIEAEWKILSEIHDGEHAPPQYKLPVKSGFLDYCRGNSIKKTGDQALEQLTANALFIEMTEKQWSLYGKIMPPQQFAAWTKKRDEWIALSRTSTQARTEVQTPKRDPRLELKTEKPTAPTNTGRTIVQEFLAFRAELMEKSHDNPYLPPPVQAIFDSGFLTYCDRGISAFPNIDLAKLEEFINQDESKFKVFSKILLPENFSKLKDKRDEIAQKIAQLRATPPAPSDAPEDDSEREIPLSGVDVSDIYSSTNDVTGLFAEFPIITLEQLKKISWDAADLYLKISLADAEKMQAYFSGADISEDHLHICRKLGKISKQMQQSYVSDPRPFDEEKTSDTQGPAHLLSQIYGGYLKRHNEETGHKARTSKVKKSAKKTRSDNKSTSKPKKKTEKTEKNIKPKQKSRSGTKKSIEPKTLDESQTLNEEARQQLKDANALIRRKNEELNNTQQ